MRKLRAMAPMVSWKAAQWSPRRLAKRAIPVGEQEKDPLHQRTPMHIGFELRGLVVGLMDLRLVITDEDRTMPTGWMLRVTTFLPHRAVLAQLGGEAKDASILLGTIAARQRLAVGTDQGTLGIEVESVWPIAAWGGGGGRWATTWVCPPLTRCASARVRPAPAARLVALSGHQLAPFIQAQLQFILEDLLQILQAHLEPGVQGFGQPLHQWCKGRAPLPHPPHRPACLARLAGHCQRR